MLKLWKWIVSLFKKPQVKLFIEAVYTESVKMLTEQLGGLAVSVVQELEAGSLTSSEKRKAAIERIKAEAKKRALYVKDYELNLLVEQAVKVVKG